MLTCKIFSFLGNETGGSIVIFIKGKIMGGIEKQETIQTPSILTPYIHQLPITKGFIMRKRIITIFLLCCVLFALIPATAQAAQIEKTQLRWNNTSYITAGIKFNGTSGFVSVFICGKSGVTNITADVKLYYKNTSGSWVEIEMNWDYDVDQDCLTIGESFTGVAGREYKIEVSGTVTKDGYAEPISKTATSTCPRS